MSLRVKHLNADSSFLLIFSPPAAAHDPQGTVPGSFSILLDPWLAGSCKIWSSKFALTSHSIPACVDSIADLPEPDVVLVSQDKNDHCHKPSLTQLRPDTGATLLATSPAAKKIKGWKHFEPGRVHALRRHDETRPDTVHRIAIPPTSPLGTAGEVTIALLHSKLDLTNLHNAFAITYTPPSPSLHTEANTQMPPTPPTTPPRTVSLSNDSCTSIHAKRPAVEAILNKEKTISVLYAPHGVAYAAVKAYVDSHLAPLPGALPFAVMLHAFDRAFNPWYLGGNISMGSPSGLEIAGNVGARTWISAHDEEKITSGIGTLTMKTEKFAMEDLREALSRSASGSTTRLLDLDVGEDFVTAVS